MLARQASFAVLQRPHRGHRYFQGRQSGPKGSHNDTQTNTRTRETLQSASCPHSRRFWLLDPSSATVTSPQHLNGALSRHPGEQLQSSLLLLLGWDGAQHPADAPVHGALGGQAAAAAAAVREEEGEAGTRAPGGGEGSGGVGRGRLGGGKSGDVGFGGVSTVGVSPNVEPAFAPAGVAWPPGA
eukprot:1139348-Pelagomonas_calceolata.AAC.4